MLVPALLLTTLAGATPVATSSAALEPPASLERFEIDPVTDGAILSLSAGFGLLSQAIIGTGEIAPQTPGDPSKLLGIDRGVVTNGGEVKGSRIVSDTLVAGAFAYAAVDTVLTAVLDSRHERALSYLVIYLETMSLNLAAGNLAKIAVRRPRPEAYQAVAAGGTIEDTDSSLSFYSMHTAFTAGLGATATYLAFERGGEVEPWVVLGATVVVTSVVGTNRVLGRAHFPTDVIAGALAGAGLGVLVPHLHRRSDLRLSVGPGPGEAGLSLSGVF